MTILPRTASDWRALRGRSGSIARSALVLSCFLHLLVLLGAPVGEVGGAHEPRRRAPALPPASAALQTVMVAPLQLPASERTIRFETTPAVGASEHPSRLRATPGDSRAVASTPDSTEDGGSGSGTGEVSAPNPLRWQGFTDSRLAAGVPVPGPGQALADVLAMPQAYVSPLRQCYDSIDAHATRAREAQDWSRRDKRGWRWGISTDGIHLGPITVPVAPPPPPPGQTTWRPERDPCVDP